MKRAQMYDLVVWNTYVCVFIGYVSHNEPKNGCYIEIPKGGVNIQDITKKYDFIPILGGGYIGYYSFQYDKLLDLSKCTHNKESIISMLRGDPDSRMLAIQLLKNDGIL